MKTKISVFRVKEKRTSSKNSIFWKQKFTVEHRIVNWDYETQINIETETELKLKTIKEDVKLELQNVNTIIVLEIKWEQNGQWWKRKLLEM